jgi:hypothetical protein
MHQTSGSQSVCRDTQLCIEYLEVCSESFRIDGMVNKSLIWQDFLVAWIV